MDPKVLALAKKYTLGATAGVGAIEGAPAQIRVIETTEKGDEVTFLWVDRNGVEHVDTLSVPDAYGIWLALGNTGTQQDFIDSAGATLNGMHAVELVEGDGIELNIDSTSGSIEISASDPPEVPAGGTTGQIMTKLSGADRHAGWADPSKERYVTDAAVAALWPDPDDRPDAPTEDDAFIRLAGLAYPSALTVPTQEGDVVYNGDPQSPEWSGYDPALMEIGSGNVGTDAGDYDTVFVPKDRHIKWADGTTGAKTIPWSILRAAGSASADPATVRLAPGELVKRITVTREGAGAISAVSSDPSVAAVEVDGDEVVVSSVDEKTGSANVTISVGEDVNHLTVDVIVPVSAEFVTIWGVSWDGTSTTKWTRTDAAAEYTDPVPYMAGMTAEECSSPFDSFMPWAGMVRVSDPEAGELVAIPKFWYKLTQNGDGMDLQIANGPVEGFQVSPAHVDRGDGAGERDVVYIGRYHCGDDFKSQTGVLPKASTSMYRSRFRTGIQDLGSNIWMSDLLTRFTITFLYLVEFADWNCQNTIGRGAGDGYSSVTVPMGYTDDMPYHTGTTKNNRTTYGPGTQYRNIEGLWDNVLDWIDGCYNTYLGTSIILNPANYNDDANYGEVLGKPVSGFPSKFAVATVSGVTLFYPTEAKGSGSTYSCDQWEFYTSDRCLAVGGYYTEYSAFGLLHFEDENAWTSRDFIGSRVQKLPMPSAAPDSDG